MSVNANGEQQTSRGSSSNGLAGPQVLLCSVNEAAAVLGLGRTVTYRLINDGTLHSVKIEGRRLVPRVSIERFVANLAERPS